MTTMPPRTVGALMTDAPATVGPEETLDAAHTMFALVQSRHLPVVRGGRLVGILSERDLLRAELPVRFVGERARMAHLQSVRVEAVMTPTPKVASPSDDVVDATRTMLNEGFSCLPVVRHGDLVGIVTTSDVVLVAIEHLRLHAEELGDAVSIGSLMTAHPTVIAPSDRLDLAGLLMHFGHFRHLPVVEDGALVGILSDRDVLAALRSSLEKLSAAERLLDKASVRVREVMTPRPITFFPTAPAVAAARALLEQRISALPVVEHGRVIGIITERDFLGYLVDRLAGRGPASAPMSG
jgi:acetoin utilization protein AcuB